MDAPGGFAPRPGVLGALQLPAEADKLWRAFHWEAAAGSGELLASWKLLSFQKTEKSFCSVWIKTKFFLYIYIFKPLHFQGTGNTAFQPALLDSFIGLCHNKSEVRRNRKALLSNNRGWGSGKGSLNQRQAWWVTVLPAEDKIHVPEVWLKSRGYKALHLNSPAIQNKSRCLFGKWGALSWIVTGLFGQANTGLFLRHIWTDAFSLLRLSSHIWSFTLSPDPAKDPVLLLTTKNCFYLLRKLVWPWFSVL